MFENNQIIITSSVNKKNLLKKLNKELLNIEISSHVDEKEFQLENIGDIDGVEIDRVFLSKIFRSEDLGVSFESTLLTNNSITVEVTKENYSKVNSVVMELYKDNGDKIDDRTLRFENGNIETVEFSALYSNSDYVVKMTQISSQNVIVDEGYSISKTIRTLKQKPTIGDLAYDIDKKNSSFNLNVTSVTDPDYGIVNYRYEVYFVEEETCSDGNPPDMYGCCTGEDFVLLPDGERACCAESTGECFPPM